MNVKAKLVGAAIGALGFCGASSAAFATSVTPAGERAGLDLATPLPQGVYFMDTASIGNFRNAAPGIGSALDYNVPALIWSTPWSLPLLGAHITFAFAAPQALLGEDAYLGHGQVFKQGMYMPLLAGGLGWNFGNGFSATYYAGAYLPVTGGTFDPLFDQAVFTQVLALAYQINGWKGTANLNYGVVGKNNTDHLLGGGLFANYFNYDLALTKHFDKWELGIIGYGSTDTSTPYRGYKQQSQFALGGLAGYNFGPVITQLMVATDIYSSNYGQKETRGTLRVIIPLWHPEAPAAVAAKY